MTTMTLSQFRETIADTLNRVTQEGERIVLRENGEEQAVLISVEDARLLEWLEDRLDALDAKRALREFEVSGEEAIPLEDVAKEPGIELEKSEPQ